MRHPIFPRLSRTALVLAVLIVLAVPVAAAQAEAPSQAGITATVTDDVRLRAGPGTNFPFMTVVPAGTTVQVLGRNEAANWIYVDFAGARGWIAAWLAAVNSNLAALPVTNAGGGWQPASTGVTATSTVLVRLRSGPGTGYPTVVLSPGGTAMPVVGRTAAADWLLVEYRSMRGWVYTWYLTVAGDLNAVPVVGAGASISPQAGAQQVAAQPAPPPAPQSAPQSAPQPAPQAAPLPRQTGDYTVYSDAAEMIRLINRVRCERGLAPVVENGLLYQAALEHAVDMATGNFFSHVDPNGRRMSDHVSAQGYSYTWIGENLAAGRGSAGETFAQWMDSSAHQAIILGADYREAGLAHVYRAGTTYGHYWVLELATRAGAPTVSCASVGY